MKRGVVALLLALVVTATPVQASDWIMGRATVYSVEGTTKMGTQTRFGVCASGNPEYLGKKVIVYQRLPDNTLGEPIGLFTVEDTGCKKEVIDIWCPESWQKTFIDKTYQNGCEGKIFIQVIE